jgi:hypothetical protein
MKLIVDANTSSLFFATLVFLGFVLPRSEFGLLYVSRVRL